MTAAADELASGPADMCDGVWLRDTQKRTTLRPNWQLQDEGGFWKSSLRRMSNWGGGPEIQYVACMQHRAATNDLENGRQVAVCYSARLYVSCQTLKLRTASFWFILCSCSHSPTVYTGMNDCTERSIVPIMQ